MKVQPRLLMTGDLHLELVAETDIEFAVLRQLWEHGTLSRANGDSVAPTGGSVGFHIKMEKDQLHDR